MLYFLDLLGTLAFSITGAYKAKQAKLSIFGVVFLGIITAVGGGTVRDLIINRVPLFYLRDPNYLLICIIGGLLTYLMPALFKKGYSFFRLIDSIGLAAFAIIGVSISYSHLFNSQHDITLISLLACVFLGMLTGFGGGVVRDAIMGDTPLSLKNGSNYVLSAFLGSLLFYLLMFFNLIFAMSISIIITLTLREIISNYGIYHRATNHKKNL